MLSETTGTRLVLYPSAKLVCTASFYHDDIYCTCNSDYRLLVYSSPDFWCNMACLTSTNAGLLLFLTNFSRTIVVFNAVTLYLVSFYYSFFNGILYAVYT